MSDLIRVPYTELFERAFRIRQQAEAVRIELQTLNETVESIGWIGRRADRFFLMWEESKQEMENWVRTLEMFASDLENQARRIQMVDEGL
jgi:uncharacterized protein YukE